MTLGFVLLYHIVLLAMTSTTMARMLLVWGASTCPQYLKAVSDSEQEGSGKVSDSEMPALTGFGYFASPQPISPEMHQTIYFLRGTWGLLCVSLYLNISSEKPACRSRSNT